LVSDKSSVDVTYTVF